MKRILIFILFVFLTSCAGDGSKIIPDTTIDNKNATSLFFYRTGGYIAGGVLVGLEVNGNEIAKLGTKEFTQYAVKGDYSISVYGTGIGGFGMGGGRVTGKGEKGSKRYFLISVDAGLLTSSFTIDEITETTFKQMR